MKAMMSEKDNGKEGNVGDDLPPILSLPFASLLYSVQLALSCPP